MFIFVILVISVSIAALLTGGIFLLALTSLPDRYMQPSDESIINGLKACQQTTEHLRKNSCQCSCNKDMK